ncbi:MAG: HDOD domain-containing protein [Nitrosomonas sp.]
MANLISTLKNGKAGFFALLAERLSEKGDFPILSESYQYFEELLQSEEANNKNIVDAILSDFTLTQKIIRLANSEMYAKRIKDTTTISKAVAMLGLHVISNISSNIQVIDILSTSTPDSDEAHGELKKAILAGSIARNIVTKSTANNKEEAVVCALMHHVGRLMLVFYFPNEWSKIQKATGGEYTRENAASLEIIGVTIDEISLVIARIWGFPAKISHSMIRARAEELETPNILGSTNWLKAIANFCGNVSTMLDQNISQKDLEDFVAHSSRTLLVSKEDILESIKMTQDNAGERSTAPEIDPSRKNQIENFRRKLSIGIFELVFAQKKKIDLRSAADIIVRTMYASQKFDNVIIFLPIEKYFRVSIFEGILSPEILPELNIPKSFASNVFHLSIYNGIDVYIKDISKIKESSLPSWFKKYLPNTRSFILLPIISEGQTYGLIYAECMNTRKDFIELSELNEFKLLRDQLLLSLSLEN